MRSHKSLLVFVSACLACNLMTSCHTDPPTSPSASEDQQAARDSWQQVVENDLNLLGHRNWILVVDKAFPEQSSAGMKYIYVEQDLLPTLHFVLDLVESSTHVKPMIYQDKELSFITEDQVPGIGVFRSESARILEGRNVNSLLHDEVFKMLDESSSLFRTLVIKTNCTIPYTSVFLQLDCAYWGAENERELRNRMTAR